MSCSLPDTQKYIGGKTKKKNSCASISSKKITLLHCNVKVDTASLYYPDKSSI